MLQEVSRRPRTLELACGHTIETTADRKAKHEKMMVKSVRSDSRQCRSLTGLPFASQSHAL
jgi:hypothetical protein